MHTNIHLLPREISFDNDLDVRATGTDETHVRTLRNLYRNGIAVDPITVRKVSSHKGTKVTYSYVLVDGMHRLTAFEEAFPNSNEGIHCVVIVGDQKDAFMAALMADRKVTRSLTSMERVNAAWKIVRRFPEVSKRDTVEATGVSRTTVGTMRMRWKALCEAGTTEVSGNWMTDKETSNWQPSEMSQEEFRRRATSMKRKLRQAAGKSQRHNFDLFATALVEAFSKDELIEAVKWFDDYEDAMINTDF